ncbi:MAG: CGNR zinc finger domain-containing protein [Mycobacterium sp.]
MPDPRPLVGEPLPLDLLNTRWIDGDHRHDLLETIAGTTIWIESAGVDASCRPAAIDEKDRRRLCAAREAIATVAETPDDPHGRQLLNDVLSHGHRVLSLNEDGPASEVMVDRGWRIPWLAAERYLDLLARSPDRIRKCRHPRCVLWYLDTSRSGTRRWCSMTTCGNRAKGNRHYQNRRAR